MHGSKGGSLKRTYGTAVVRKELNMRDDKQFAIEAMDAITQASTSIEAELTELRERNILNPEQYRKLFNSNWSLRVLLGGYTKDIRQNQSKEN